MRYIRIPEPVQCIDATTDKPTAEVLTFARAASIVCASLVQKQAIDTLDAIAMRDSLSKAHVGEEVAIDSAWWEALKSEFRRTNALGVGYLLAAAPHIRAVVDAKETPSSRSEEKAVLMAESANGASAAAAS